MTRVHMLRFPRHYKDTTQEILTILISFCSKFIKYAYTKNYENRALFDEVIAKIKWCSCFLTHSVHYCKFSATNQVDT